MPPVDGQDLEQLRAQLVRAFIAGHAAAVAELQREIAAPWRARPQRRARPWGMVKRILRRAAGS